MKTDWELRILLFTTPKTVGETGDDRPVRNLLAFVWRMSGRHQFALGGLALLVAGLTVVPLELQRRIVDDALAEADLRLLGILAIAYLAVILVTGLTKLLLRLYQGWLSESAILYCRNHLTSLRDRSPGEEDKGTAVSIVNSEIEAVGGFVGTGFSDPVSQAGILIAVFGYMIVVEPLIALFSLAFLVPQAVLAPLLQRKLNILVEERIDRLRQVSDEIASAGEGEARTDAFISEVRHIFTNRIRFYVWKFSGKAMLNLLNAAAPLMVLAVGGWMVIQGQTEIGVVVAFISGFNRMADPSRELIANYRLFAQTSVKHEMIASWMKPHLGQRAQEAT